MDKSKRTIVVSQIIEIIEITLGAVWAFLFISVALVSMTDDVVDGAGIIIFMWMLGFLGVWLVFMGIRRRRMRLEFKKYAAQLLDDPTGLIENIASAAGTPQNVVKKNLEFMIKKGFFTNAYIDKQNNRLVLASLSQNNQANLMRRENINNPAFEKPSLVTCKCPNCGGVNVITQGIVSECDFCGSPIQG